VTVRSDGALPFRDQLVELSYDFWLFGCNVLHVRPVASTIEELESYGFSIDSAYQLPAISIHCHGFDATWFRRVPGLRSGFFAERRHRFQWPAIGNDTRQAPSLHLIRYRNSTEFQHRGHEVDELHGLSDLDACFDSRWPVHDQRHACQL
jgi:hypothetical protein